MKKRRSEFKLVELAHLAMLRESGPEPFYGGAAHIWRLRFNSLVRRYRKLRRWPNYGMVLKTYPMANSIGELRGLLR